MSIMESRSAPNGSDELIAENAQLRSEVARLTEENLRLRRALYGTKSEQMAQPAGPKVGQEAGAFQEDGSLGTSEASTKSSQEAKQGVADQKHKKPGRRRLPAHLPREEEVCMLSGDELKCSCGCTLVEFDEEISEQITIEPVRYKVIERKKKKYKCCGCGKTIKTAKAAPSILPGSSYASPEFCAHVAISKCQYSLPLYRLESMLHEEGIPIDRTTLANMMMNLGEKCEPLWLHLNRLPKNSVMPSAIRCWR